MEGLLGKRAVVEERASGTPSPICRLRAAKAAPPPWSAGPLVVGTLSGRWCCEPGGS